jgi:isopentenyl diphosphate isomerase/L-lactate dehydrogenase-like FMN-dependent dehydrogenase
MRQDLHDLLVIEADIADRDDIGGRDMAAGIDDETTLRANREGFQKFLLRPRRLVDVSKVDMSLEIFGMKYNSPIFVAPTGGHKGYHADGEIGVANAAKAGNHGMILSTQATTSIEDVIAARGQPIWYQLYATNKWEVAEHHIKRAEKAVDSELAKLEKKLDRAEDKL